MVESSSRKKVVITGITGYLGSTVCDLFLKDGTFSVRGTVRDKKNEKKLAPLVKAFGDNFQHIELFEADLLNSDSLEKAIEGCDYVVHTASPFPIAIPKDENVLIKPAVEGTLAVVRAAHKYRVKRVVITSSCAAVMNQTKENMKELYDENDWSDLKACTPYDKSKTLAERAAWEFLHSLPLEERFELVTINPVLIMGPSIVQTDFSSGLIVKKLILGKYPGVPKIIFPIVDVRECALAHLQALKVPEARNRRFLLNSESVWFRDMAVYLKNHFPDYPVKTTQLPYCPVKMASLFDDSIRLILPIWNKTIKLDNTASIEILGIQYRPGAESIVAIAESMIEAGLINDRRRRR